MNLIFTNKYDIPHDDLVPLELLMDTMRDIILNFKARIYRKIYGVNFAFY